MTERMPRILLIALVAGGLTVALGGLHAAEGIVGPAMLALVLTITVHPLRARLERFKLPEWAISLIVVVVVYLLLFAVVVSLVYGIGQLAALLPQYSDEIQKDAKNVSDWLQKQGIASDPAKAASDSVSSSKIVTWITALFSGILGVLSNLFFIITLALFMAFDTRATQRVFAHVAEVKPDLVEAMRHFARGTRTYMGVTTVFGLIVAVIDGLALALIGIPGAFTWAVLAFVTNFIPNVGFVIGVIPPAVMGLLDGGPSEMLLVILVYSVINVVIQSIIQPRVVGGTVGLTPTITMVSLVFWAWLIGALGALLAVPLSLLMKAVLIEADPSARWVLPIISGRLPDPDRDPDDEEPGPDPDGDSASDDVPEAATEPV